MTESEWLASTDPFAMLVWLRDSGVVGRRLHLFACACVRAIWPLLTDPRSRAAAAAAEAAADGRLPVDELRHARKLSHRARMKTPDNFSTPAAAAHALLIPDTHFGGIGLAMHVSLLVRDAEDGFRGSHGRYFNAADPFYAPSHPVQANLLRDIFGNPFWPVACRAEWLEWNEGVVVKMARTIYEERAVDRLPILADALEDSGCGEVTILDHLRDPAAHVKGCWVIDALTGRSPSS